ncbi:unnamed protein product, partial [Mycena citricolor]
MMDERERASVEALTIQKKHANSGRLDDVQHDQLQTNDPHQRQSPSPTHGRPSRFTHKRRDSDTLRSVPNVASVSPSGSSMPGSRLSPTVRSLSSSGVSAAAAKHRRSGTAPEQPTTSGMLGPSGPSSALGRTWSGERESLGWENQPSKERETTRERERRPLQLTQQQLEAQQHIEAQRQQLQQQIQQQQQLQQQIQQQQQQLLLQQQQQ